jgi:hypothetical protein
MVGVCKFFIPGKHFGFVAYSSVGSDCFDSELFVHGDNLHGYIPTTGDALEFEVGQDEVSGRTQVIDAFPCPRYNGIVDRAFSGGGRIRTEDGQVFHFGLDDVIPDLIARRLLTAETKVEFRIHEGRAVDVLSIDPTLDTIGNPDAYREYGRVDQLAGDHFYIIRPSGDRINCLMKNVVSEGSELIERGTWVYYRPNCIPFRWSKDRRTFYNQIFANEVFVCLGNEAPEMIANALVIEPGSAEAAFLAAPELPLAEQEVSVYSPEDRKIPLRDLIRRQSRHRVA